MSVQNSINTALGVAAIASGLTNRKQVEKAQEKLDDTKDKLTSKESQLANTEENLANTKKDLAETKAEKSALEDEKNMQYGLNTFNVSNDLPNAKETNTDGDKSIDVDKNSVNNLGSSINDYIKSNQKVNPVFQEKIMGVHALRMRDAKIETKKALEEISKSTINSILERIARKNGGNE